MPSVRVTLTKSEAESLEGMELISICQTIALDGVLTNSEVLELRGWLNRNRHSKLKAASFLCQIVDDIVADKRVTSSERLALQKALERVLPASLRAEVKEKRERAAARIAGRLAVTKENEKAKRDQSRLLKKPLVSADFMVAGVRYEGRPRIIRKYAQEGLDVELRRMPRHQFSPHAIAIHLLNGKCIGFVPEVEAVDLSPYLDQHHPYWARIKKILTRTRFPIPVVRAYTYRHDADLENLRRPTFSDDSLTNQGLIARLTDRLLRKNQ